MNSDPKKCKAFIRGLTPALATLAYTYHAPDFASLVSYAIQAEKLRQEERAQQKRKIDDYKTQRQEQRRQKSFAGPGFQGSYISPNPFQLRPGQFPAGDSERMLHLWKPRALRRRLPTLTLQ